MSGQDGEMTRYQRAVMAEFDEAVRHARTTLAAFMVMRELALKDAGGGSIDGAKTGDDGKLIAFIAFAWGETATDLKEAFTSCKNTLEPLEIKENLQ